MSSDSNLIKCEKEDDEALNGVHESLEKIKSPNKCQTTKEQCSSTNVLLTLFMIRFIDPKVSKYRHMYFWGKCCISDIKMRAVAKTLFWKPEAKTISGLEIEYDQSKV